MYRIGGIEQVVDVLGTGRKTDEQQHQQRHASWSRDLVFPKIIVNHVLIQRTLGYSDLDYLPKY